MAKNAAHIKHQYPKKKARSGKQRPSLGERRHILRSLEKHISERKTFILLDTKPEKEREARIENRIRSQEEESPEWR